VADAAQRLRWYLINLDLNGIWHNVHTHAARWRIPNPLSGAIDVHPLSPTEGFVIGTRVPRPLRLLPVELEDLQEHPPNNACRVTIRRDSLLHCHIEEHMMQGLAGLVRERECLWITDGTVEDVEVTLPFNDGNCCPPIDGSRVCGPAGAANPEMPGMPGMGSVTMPGMEMGDASVVLADVEISATNETSLHT
jgi:hypothetical protein